MGRGMRKYPDDVGRRSSSLAGSVLVLLGILLFVPAGEGKDPVAAQPCQPTRADSEGPFYKPGAPLRTSTGSGLVVRGPPPHALPWGGGAGGRFQHRPHPGKVRFPGGIPPRRPLVYWVMNPTAWFRLKRSSCSRGAQRERDERSRHRIDRVGRIGSCSCAFRRGAHCRPAPAVPPRGGGGGGGGGARGGARGPADTTATGGMRFSARRARRGKGSSPRSAGSGRRPPGRPPEKGGGWSSCASGRS